MAGVIHRAGPDDLDHVVALVRECCQVDGRAFHDARVLTALQPLLADDALGQVWLVDDPERPGEPAGYAVVTWGWSLGWGGRACRLDELYVRSHGNKLATKVLAEVVEQARAAGAGAVFVETEAHDRHARGFYGQRGFDLEDSLWMSLRLAPPG
jgi:GNAT superfamily N-acetyltransferase